MGLFSLFARRDEESYVQPYALADGSYLYQARCTCGWFTDVYVEEREFVSALREDHAVTHQE